MCESKHPGCLRLACATGDLFSQNLSVLQKSKEDFKHPILLIIAVSGMEGTSQLYVRSFMILMTGRSY